VSGRALSGPRSGSALVATHSAERAVRGPLAACSVSTEGAVSSNAYCPQFDAATVEAIVRDSCEQQHVPPRLNDADVVRRVATLLGGPVALIRARAGSAALSHVKTKGAADGSGSPKP
jgi:hypothetical protein